MVMNLSMNERLSRSILKYRTRRKEADRLDESSTFFSLCRPVCTPSHIQTFTLRYSARENGIYCSADCPVTSLAKEAEIRLFLDEVNHHLSAGEIHYLFLEPNWRGEHEAFINIGMGLVLDDTDQVDVTPMLDEMSAYLEHIVVVLGEAILKIIGGGDAEALAQDSIDRLPVWDAEFMIARSEYMPLPAHLRYDEAEEEAI